MNVIAQLEFELVCYDVVDKYFNHFATRASPFHLPRFIILDTCNHITVCKQMSIIK